MIKECRSFVGMVNFVSIFCPELQGLLKPIYDLTHKGRHFVWGKEQQNAFTEIKVGCKDPQCYTCQIAKEGFSCTLIQQICDRKCSISNPEWQAQAYCLCE